MQASCIREGFFSGKSPGLPGPSPLPQPVTGGQRGPQPKTPGPPRLILTHFTETWCPVQLPLHRPRLAFSFSAPNGYDGATAARSSQEDTGNSVWNRECTLEMLFLVTSGALVIREAVVAAKAWGRSGTHRKGLAASRTLGVMSLFPTQLSADSCSSAQGGVGTHLLGFGGTGCSAWGWGLISLSLDSGAVCTNHD